MTFAALIEEAINKINPIYFWCITIIYMALIYFFSVRSIHTDLGASHLDKIVHLSCYALMSFLLALALVKTIRRKKNFFVTIIAIVAPSLYGGGIEVVQGLVPGRTASFADALANTIGAILGVYALTKINKYLGGQKNAPA